MKLSNLVTGSPPFRMTNGEQANVSSGGHPSISMQAGEYALTGCNLGTGTVSTTYNPQKRYGPQACLEVHENTHVAFEKDCCAKAKACFDKYTTDNRCLDAYNKWLAHNLNYNECQAYTKEIECLKIFPTAGLGVREQGALRNRLTEATQYHAGYCAGAKAPSACPFNDTGDII